MNGIIHYDMSNKFLSCSAQEHVRTVKIVENSVSLRGWPSSEHRYQVGVTYVVYPRSSLQVQVHCSAWSACLSMISPSGAITSAPIGIPPDTPFKHTFNFVQSDGCAMTVCKTVSWYRPASVSYRFKRSEGAESLNAHSLLMARS